MYGIDVRELVLEDAPELQRYYTRLLAEAPVGIFHRPAPSLDEEIEFLASHIDRCDSTVIGAFDGASLVGMMSFSAKQRPQECHAGSMGITVAADYRDRGIGSTLIAHLVDWAPFHGIHRIEVQVFATNQRAKGLYERLGFVEEGRLRDAIAVDGAYVDEYVMSLLITSTRTQGDTHD